MVLFAVLLSLCLGGLVKCGDWCYHGCSNSPSLWKNMHGSFCGGHRQSPINIETAYVQTDMSLVNFNFVNFSSPNALKLLKNTGHTVKCELKENEVEVSGGGLDATYSVIQFHFHWGEETDYKSGSEHTINDNQYPMEMHVVSLKKGLSLSEALADPQGIAVLGFFIQATEDGAVSEAWENFTSYLDNVTYKGDEVNITHSISMNDLIGNVNLTKFYRYNGSLTTPNCSEAVVWTVFHDPIKINKTLITKFPQKTQLSNVFRLTQELNCRQVLASKGVMPHSHQWCYHHCDHTPADWLLLPHAHCGGDRQSPINIVSKSAEKDDRLKKFTYRHFNDKNAIEYIINTGHTVKVVLKNNTVEILGGGLEHVYSVLQFHFHWGNISSNSMGSEHTVDSKRYPMEMHIVSKRKDLSLEQALTESDGLAVLGFFIDVQTSAKSEHTSSSQHQEQTQTTAEWHPWKNLSSYLPDIGKAGCKVKAVGGLSIDDLLGDVNRAVYYRYNGSLTTPSCNEAVVWTVFKYPIKIDASVIEMFPVYTGHQDVYRPSQSLHARKVYISAASSPSESVALLMLLACLYGLTVE